MPGVYRLDILGPGDRPRNSMGSASSLTSPRSCVRPHARPKRSSRWKRCWPAHHRRRLRPLSIQSWPSRFVTRWSAAGSTRRYRLGWDDTLGGGWRPHPKGRPHSAAVLLRELPQQRNVDASRGALGASRSGGMTDLEPAHQKTGMSRGRCLVGRGRSAPCGRPPCSDVLEYP